MKRRDHSKWHPKVEAAGVATEGNRKQKPLVDFGNPATRKEFKDLTRTLWNEMARRREEMLSRVFWEKAHVRAVECGVPAEVIDYLQKNSRLGWLPPADGPKDEDILMYVEFCNRAFEEFLCKQIPKLAVASPFSCEMQNN